MTDRLLAYLRTFTGFGRDARLFLLTTILFGAATALYWIDFNLYLKSIGFDPSVIGWLLATSQLAGVVVSLPAGALSDVLGRRVMMAVGMALMTVAILLSLTGQVVLLFVGVAALGAGAQTVNAVQVPFIAEHTRPEERNEYFSTWSAASFLSGVLAAVVGAWVAVAVAGLLGFHDDASQCRVLLAGVVLLGLAALVSISLLTSDKPSAPEALAERPPRLRIAVSDKGLFFRLLLPGFITSLGAGQLIPFLNLFVQTKFNLDIPAVNVIFGITSLGTAAAIMAQPALARRFGRIGSIVLVQGASIPFLVVLGFSPVLWTVIVAMAVRNSLMNAGSPIFDAFAMDRVSNGERATLSAFMTLLWALGWTIAPLYYSTLQDRLGFTAGYTVDFVTIIILYTVATALLWVWFRSGEAVAQPVPQAGVSKPVSTALAQVEMAEGAAAFVEHA